jgi:hypothetical protein
MQDNQNSVQLIATLENGDIVLQHQYGRLERRRARPIGRGWPP